MSEIVTEKVEISTSGSAGSATGSEKTGPLHGFLLDVYAVREGMPGKDPWAVLAINAFGFAVIIATAYSVRWFKSHPWRKPPEPKSETGRAAAPL